MKRINIGRTVALLWLTVAIGVTIALGPQLGWRGWIWLGGHHLLCVFGVSHELWRKRGV